MSAESANSSDNSSQRRGVGKLILGLGGLAAALVSVITLYQLVTPDAPPSARGDFLAVTVDSGDGGVWVNYETEIEGYAGQECPVRWTLYDADLRAEYSDSQFQDELAGMIEPSRYVDQGADKVWIPEPSRDGNYYVRLELFAPSEAGQNMSLDYADSEVFIMGTGSAADDQYSSEASDDQYSSE